MKNARISKIALFLVACCLFVDVNGFADVNTPPAAISNLTALAGQQDGAIALKWTAPGDADVSGTVTTYLVKYASCQINASDFMTSATYYHAWAAASAFVAGGSEEQRVVTGLTAGSTYFFAIEGQDSAGNYGVWYSSWDSADVNNDNFALAVNVAPGPITEISADVTNLTEGRARLTWIAPGDDGYSGALTAGSRFRLQYSTDSASAWDVNTPQLDFSTSSVNPGSSQSAVITGLLPSATYFFRVWTKDENMSNWSAVSAGATYWAQLDVSSPVAITGVTIVENGFRHVTLKWSAPCEDSGAAPYNTSISTLTYNIKYATFTISSENLFQSASTFAVLASSYTRPGNYETFTVTGLANGTTYYFSIKSYDERNQWSVISSSSPKAIPFNTAPNAATFTGDLQNNATHYINSTSYNFTWSGNNPGSNDSLYGDSISSYTVYFSSCFSGGGAGTIGRSTLTVYGVSASNYLATNLSENATYWVALYTYDSESAVSVNSFNKSFHYISVNAANEPPYSFTQITSSGIVHFKDYPPYDEKLSFSWNLTSDPDPGDHVSFYRLYYSTAANFDVSFTTVVPNLLSSPYSVTHSLINDATYYWFVVVQDSGMPFNYNVKVTSSSIWSVVVNCENTQPNAPQLFSPANTSVIYSQDYQLNWLASTDPDPDDSISKYKIYYSSQTSDIGPLVSLSSQTEILAGISTYTVLTNLADNATYYWCADVYDNADSLTQLYGAPYFVQKTSTSQISYFVVNHTSETPSSFDLISPIGSTNPAVTTSMYFTWNATSDPDPFDHVDHYVLKFSPTSNFSVGQTTWTSSIYTTTTTVIFNFSPAVNYYWNVTAYDTTGLYTTCNSTGIFIIATTAPSTFTLTVPEGIIRTLTPSFTWTASSDPDPYDSIAYYRLYYSADSNFVSNVTTWTANIVSSSTGYNIPPNMPLVLRTTYYWNVRAYDATGLYTLSSSTGLFYVQNSSPSIFDLVYPTGSFIVQTKRPVLNWQPSIDLDNDTLNYTVTHSTFANFISSSVYNVVSSSFFAVAADLSENTTYYWKVCVTDGYEFRNSLATGIFIVNALPEYPLAFGLISSSGVVNTSVPVFTWAASSDLDSGDYLYYSIYYSSDNFKTLYSSSGLKSPLFNPPASFEENATYKWYASATDSTGLKTLSNSTWSITINGTDGYPDTFDLVSSTGWIVNTRKPKFVWTKADKTEWWDPTTYKLECFNVNNPLDVVTRSGITITTYTLDVSLQENSSYWWRIEATDLAGHSRYSNQIFYIFISSVNDPPNNFGLISPSSASVTDTRAPQLVWETAIDPDESSGDRIAYYSLYYSTCPDFKLYNMLSNIVASSYTILQEGRLRQNSTYYWKVTAFDAFGSSTTSTTWDFFVPSLQRLKSPEIFLQAILSPDMSNFVMTWPVVSTYEDGTNADDLAGYNVYRSINPIADYVFAGFTDTNKWTDTDVNGQVYYYFVRTVGNTGIESVDSQTVSSEFSNKTIAATLEKDAYVILSNTMAGNMRSANRRVDIVKNSNIYEIKVLRTDTGAEVSNYTFSESLILNFVINNSVINSAASRIQSFSGKPAVFWDNGVEYINIGGELDAVNNKVYVRTSYTGKYQLRDISNSDFSFSLEPKKIFTPNGKGLAVTETMKFRYVNTTGEQLTGEIYDLSGAFIAKMQPKSNLGDYLEWNGKTDSGDIVKKGIYLYQLKVGGKIYTGTIIVAR